MLGTRGFAAVCCNKPEGCVHQEISQGNPEQRQHQHNTDAASTKPGVNMSPRILDAMMKGSDCLGFEQAVAMGTMAARAGRAGR